MAVLWFSDFHSEWIFNTVEKPLSSWELSLTLLYLFLLSCRNGSRGFVCVLGLGLNMQVLV